MSNDELIKLANKYCDTAIDIYNNCLHDHEKETYQELYVFALANKNINTPTEANLVIKYFKDEFNSYDIKEWLE